MRKLRVKLSIIHNVKITFTIGSEKKKKYYQPIRKQFGHDKVYADKIVVAKNDVGPIFNHFLYTRGAILVNSQFCKQKKKQFLSSALNSRSPNNKRKIELVRIETPPKEQDIKNSHKS